jgi:hypothetical protein
MQTYDWSQFHLHIPVKTKLETLYRLWATQQGPVSWFLRKALQFIPTANGWFSLYLVLCSLFGKRDCSGYPAEDLCNGFVAE